MQTWLDHLVVTAPTLDAGKAFIANALGVDPVQGGVHPRMATHNLLLSLGEECYLEVIAPLPAAIPEMPRWFGLDALQSLPRLATWVARTDDLAAASQVHPAAGAIQPMSRGALNWLITITPDGSMPEHGSLPALIQWQSSPHPAATLPASGCSLIELQIFHPNPHVIQAQLHALNLSTPITISQIAASEQPHIQATIATPHGVKVLT